MSAQSLAERADACLALLDDAGRATALRVVLRLVSFGDGPSDARRQQPVSALQAGDDPAHCTAILHQLTEACLVTIASDQVSGEPLVELAHGLVVDSWPTLEAWVRAHGETEQLRRQLEADAASWRQRGGDRPGDAGLLDKTQLSELAAWLTADARRRLGVSADADSFITASRVAARRGWWPGKTSMAGALAILLILMLLATPIILLFVVVLSAWVIHRFG
jgi:hypothetical protein